MKNNCSLNGLYPITPTAFQSDLEYIDNWSFRKDLYIAIMTIPAILLGTGE